MKIVYSLFFFLSVTWNTELMLFTRAFNKQLRHSVRPSRTVTTLDIQNKGKTDPIPDEYIQEHVRAADISWYPGHIAKAERELADYLKKVDVVIEVRDARIPLATTHPMVRDLKIIINIPS